MTDDQKRPSVAITENGKFVTVWQSYGQDGSGYGVFGEMGQMVGLADFNNDGFVNFRDYCILADEWLKSGGTLTTDLQVIYDRVPLSYDDITYNPGHIILKNTTASKELNMYFDETTGRLKFLGGENYVMGDWMYLSVYPEINKNLNTGSNTFVLSDNFNLEPTVTVDIDVTVGGGTSDFIYALLPHNPLDIPLPNGTSLLYMEQKLTDHSVIQGNITMTIQFPSSIQLDENFIYLYAWNLSGSEDWDLAPESFYDHSVTYDLVNNRIIMRYKKNRSWKLRYLFNQ